MLGIVQSGFICVNIRVFQSDSLTKDKPGCNLCNKMGRVACASAGAAGRPFYTDGCERNMNMTPFAPCSCSAAGTAADARRSRGRRRPGRSEYLALLLRRTESGQPQHRDGQPSPRRPASAWWTARLATRTSRPASSPASPAACCRTSSPTGLARASSSWWMRARCSPSTRCGMRPGWMTWCRPAWPTRPRSTTASATSSPFNIHYGRPLLQPEGLGRGRHRGAGHLGRAAGSLRRV